VIQACDLEDPSQVLRGQKVQVEVSSGSTRLLFEAQAQGSGRHGETIAVRNPASGRIFHARVEEAGRVTVLPAAAMQAATRVIKEGEK
jgi:flagella basal body P-ring formation protein FlgA